jgi:hypothetical protein
MIRSSLIALLLAASFCLAAFAAPGSQTNPVYTMPGSDKPVVFRGEVLHQLPNSITVRNLDPDHPREVRTFSYADDLKNQMQKIFDAGGYQYGDKIEILYKPGSTVALRIAGKPSKPI